MTYKEFQSFMTSYERKLFKENVIVHCNKTGQVFTSVKKYLEPKLNDTFTSILMGSFTFNETPQGYNYWKTIADREFPSDKLKTHAPRITREQANVQYSELLKKAKEENKLLKAKGLNLFLSPYEIEDYWKQDRYLYPISFWELSTVDKYLKSYADKLRNAEHKYQYAHKRVQAYLSKNA